jgi:hypothetical protein
MRFSFLVRPSRPRPQQAITESGNSLDLFWRLVLVSRMLNRGKTQTRTAERIASVEPLVRVLGT